MSNEPETSYQRQVEVAQPDGSRRVVATERAYQRERRFSPGLLVALAAGVVAVMGLIFFFVINQRDQEHEQEVARLEASERAAQQRAAEQQRPVIVQQPAAPAPAQPPVVVQQPAPAQQPPVVIQQAAPPVETKTVTKEVVVPAPLDDSSIQILVDEKMRTDQELATLSLTATVVNGKVMLLGSVPSNDLKRRAENTVKKVKGVRGVDNQITVVKS